MSSLSASRPCKMTFGSDWRTCSITINALSRICLVFKCRRSQRTIQLSSKLRSSGQDLFFWGDWGAKMSAPMHERKKRLWNNDSSVRLLKVLDNCNDHPWHCQRCCVQSVTILVVPLLYSIAHVEPSTLIVCAVGATADLSESLAGRHPSFNIKLPVSRSSELLRWHIQNSAQYEICFLSTYVSMAYL